MDSGSFQAQEELVGQKFLGWENLTMDALGTQAVLGGLGKDSSFPECFLSRSQGHWGCRVCIWVLGADLRLEWLGVG